MEGTQDSGAIDVLVVEDTPSDAAALTAILARAAKPAIKASVVQRLEDAGNYLDEHRVDLVVLDLTLPDAVELQAVRRLTATHPHVPLVVLTGTDDELLGLSAIKAGAQDFVVKGSVDRSALLRTFRYAIERHRNQQQLAALTRELQDANSTLQKLTIVDPLTDLLNRRGLQQMLTREIERIQRGEAGALVLLVDIDDFKKINDALGHTAGDVALKEVAHRIRGALRATDIVSRLGGDEFMLLLPKADPYEAARIAERVRYSVGTVVLQAGDDQLHVTASIGGMMLDADTPSIDELLMRAQEILARSKTTGKNKVSFAGAEFDDTAQRLAQKADMISALSRGHRLHSAQQPIIDLRSGEIVGYEFLSRYGEPPEAMPDNFFRLCAERNVLTLVDHQCMRAAIERSLDLPPSIRRHVNIFPSTLLAVPVQHLIAELPDGAATSFCFEISESQIIGDPSYLIEPVRELRSAGACIAIDDVGFGNSCLESLVFLQPEIIKLDKRCGRGIGDDAGKAKHLERFLQIAMHVSPNVVLEGIENERDLACARELGVPFGQGYYWGMPMTVAGESRREA